MSSKNIQIECPICLKTLTFDKEYEADGHIDECLTRQLIEEEHKQRHSQETETLKTIASISATQGFSFPVMCPYEACKKQVDFGAFYQHVVSTHATAAHHRYACPLCAIQSDAVYNVNENTNIFQHVQMFHANTSGFGMGQVARPLPQQYVFSEDEEESFSSSIDEDMGEKNSDDENSANEEEESDDEETNNLNNNAAFGQNRRMSMSGMLESPVHVRSVPIGIQQVQRTNSQPNSQTRRMSLVNSPPLHFGLMGRPEYAIQTFETDSTIECSICYCEFGKGSITARLSCLCLYHKDCIDNWFARKQSYKCPYHQDATPKS